MSEARPIVVTFALSDESQAFADTPAGAEVKIIHTGVGDSSPGRESLRAALARIRPAYVVSAGYAGGLQPAVKVGDLILAENFSSPALLDAALCALADHPPRVGTLLTQDTLAETSAEKTALGLATDALAVDMETAWIAAICADAGVPLLSLRVISDASTRSFPVPGRILFDVRRQRPRHVALPLWLLAHPGRIAPFVAFVRGLGPARQSLSLALCRLLTASGSAMDSTPPP